MARIELEFEEVTLENDEGQEVDGVCATCPRCGDTEEAFGTSPESRFSCLMRLKENCTDGSHYYIDPEADDDGRPPDPVIKPWWEK